LDAEFRNGLWNSFLSNFSLDDDGVFGFADNQSFEVMVAEPGDYSPTEQKQ